MLNNQTYVAIDQAMLLSFHDDYCFDFDGPMESCEAHLLTLPDIALRQLIAEVDVILELIPDPYARVREFPCHEFDQDPPVFDRWLRTMRRRATEALAGIHSHPLEDHSEDWRDDMDP